MKFTISSILLLTAFLWLGFENVYADDDPINLMKDVNTEELTIKTISQEEYIKKLAEMGEVYVPSAPRVDGGTTVHREAIWTQNYPSNGNYTAYLSGLFEISVYGSFAQIDSANVGSGLSAGMYAADWVQTNSLVQSELPDTSATISATGHFTAQRTVATGGAIEIPGFSVTNTVGNTYYYASNPMTMTRTYTVQE